MLRAGVFKNEKTAEEQVVQVLNFDIHLQKDFRGRRYIERVTECIPIVDKIQRHMTYDYNSEKTMIWIQSSQNSLKMQQHIFQKLQNKTYTHIKMYQNMLMENIKLTNKITDQNIQLR